MVGVGLFASCGGEGASGIAGPPTTGSPPPTTPAPAVTGILLSAANLSLDVSDTTSIAVTLQTIGTAPAGGWTITWQSSDTAVATVSTTGRISARAAGSTDVSALAGGKSASVTVVVKPLPYISAIAISPISATLVVGDTLPLSAAITASGSPPSNGWPIVWRSDAASIASIGATGVVKALSAGQTSVWATLGNASAPAPITVVAGPTVTGIALSPATLHLTPGEQGSLTPSLTTVGSQPAGGWPITWTSASTAIATVDGTGRVTAVAPGSTTITATSSSASAAATVSVAPTPGGTTSTVTDVKVSPAFKAWMVTGGTKTFSASVSADGPPPQNGWPIVWTSSDPPIATVSSAGVVIAQNPGLADITATVGGKSGSTTLEVLTPPGVLSIEIDYDQFSINVGATLPITVSYQLVGGMPPEGVLTTFTTADSAIATVSPGGVLTGVAVGTTSVTATAYGKTSTRVVEVTAAPPPPPPVTGVTALAVIPQVQVVYPGGRALMYADVTATTKPPGGPYGTDDWPVQWTSSTPWVVATPTMLTRFLNYDALSTGVTTMTASLGGVTATSTIYVAAPTTIAVTPTAATLAVGEQVTLTPSVTAIGPLPASGYPVAYRSSSPLVAEVSASGVVTARGAGKTRVYSEATPVAALTVVTVTGPGLTLTLTGNTTAKGTISQLDAITYGLSCVFPMTMSATGTGTTIWGNEDWSFDGGPFKTYPGMGYAPISAGMSMIWRVFTVGGGTSTSASQVKGYTATVRTHYGVNAESYDYRSGFAEDYVITETYTCTP